MDFEAEGFRLEAFAAAGGAGGVGPVAAEEDADVHLVGLGFEPGEEAFDAIPVAGAPEFLQLLRGGIVGSTISIVDPLLVVVGEVLPRGFDVDAAFLAAADEVALAFVAAFALEGFDRALGDGEGGVRHGFFEVEADDAAEAAALGAGPERAVEGEQRGGGRAEGEAGGGIGPSGGEGFGAGWPRVIGVIGPRALDGGVAFAEVEGGFEGFEQAGVVVWCSARRSWRMVTGRARAGDWRSWAVRRCG